MCCPRLPGRLWPGRIPAGRADLRDRAAGRAAGGLEAARAGLHAGHEGAARPARREHHVRPAGRVGRRRARRRAAPDHAGRIRAGRAAGGRAGDHRRRHQDRAGVRRRGNAQARRRGAHARLVEVLACRGMAAGPQPAVVRQAVRARLAAVAGVGLGPSLGRAAAASSRPCNRANSGNIPSGIRTDHRPDLDGFELDQPPGACPLHEVHNQLRYVSASSTSGGQRAVEYWTTRDKVGTAAPDPGLRWPELVSAYASSRDNDVPPPRDRSFSIMSSGHQTRYRVVGGNPLQGTIFVQGAKNAALKMIAASLLSSSVLPAEITRQFRAAVLFVPALLHRLGEAVLEGVGGCNLGSRNLDFHYRGFARLGATVDQGESQISVKANGLRGSHLYLDTPSHTGTENLIMAASLAPGVTIIDNTAQEPEVQDVIAFLSKMGAKISGGGTGFITVEGVRELTAV